mmetsp:Transcript_85044/g.275384  ORF Transcript_85044/g.275384 Transcript_85044/m.275384 type:complete len:199 (-) Transcript_85044:55-651(-)
MAAAEPRAANLELLLNVTLALALLAVLLWRAWESRRHGARKAAARAPRGPVEAEWPLAGQASEDEAASEAEDGECQEDSEHEVGEELLLPLEDLHFGLPRCRVRAPGLEPLPAMIKWTPEEFAKEQVDVARVRIGTFGVWVAQGMKANRLLYAMKKQGGLDSASCRVVEPPPPRPAEDEENDTPDTYGPDLAKLQLIP